MGRNCPDFSGTPIISGTGKSTNFKFCIRMFIASVGRKEKSPVKISGKVPVGVVRDSRCIYECPWTAL